MVNREEWAKKFLEYCDFPVRRRNMVALMAWMAAEGSPQQAQATWNPLNTTKVMPGSTQFNYMRVQNYTSLNQGLEASKKTLFDEPAIAGYKPVITCLRDNARPRETLRHLVRSWWGTSHLAVEIVDDVKNYWNSYADAPIGQ